MKNLAKKIAKTIIPRAFHVPIVRMLASKKPLRTVYGKPSADVLDCCIAYNEFGGFCVPLSTYRMGPEQRILRGGVWEPETVSFITAHCAGGDVIHAGAHIGDFLPAISKSLGKDAKVWAFEPSPVYFRCASITMLVNNLRNVELIQSGLGRQKGAAEIVIKAEGKTLGARSWIVDENLRQQTSRDDSETTKINISAIDDIVPKDRYVSIIHLDIEGYEPAALDGAMATIQRCKPILIIEVHFSDEEWLLTKLGPLGYVKTAGFDGNYIMEA